MLAKWWGGSITILASFQKGEKYKLPTTSKGSSTEDNTQQQAGDRLCDVRWCCLELCLSKAEAGSCGLTEPSIRDTLKADTFQSPKEEISLRTMKWKASLDHFFKDKPFALVLLVNTLILEAAGNLFHYRPNFICFKNRVLSIEDSPSLFPQRLPEATKQPTQELPKARHFFNFFKFFCWTEERNDWISGCEVIHSEVYVPVF